MGRLLILSLALSLAVFGAQAKVYKWVMPDGTVKYSDSPQEEGAEEVELDPLQLYSAPPPPPLRSSPSAEGEDRPAGGYEIAVASPADDSVIRDNGGTVSISLSLSPGLQRGHTVDIIMDGKVLGSGRSTSITLRNVDRGSHSVQAAIKDADGNEVARASAVTFHLKRFAAGGG